LLAVVPLFGSACATAMYPGPRRPASELVTIETDRTLLPSIDGVATQRDSERAAFEVLPGLHAMAVTLHDVSINRVTRRAQVLCFVGEAGHRYRIQPTYGGFVWHPELVDRTTETIAPSRALDGTHRTCTTELVLGRDAPAAMTAPPAPDGASRPASVPATVESPGEPPAATGETALPPPMAQVQIENQQPPPPTARAAAPQAPNPLFDVGLELGFAQGGSDLVTATSSNGDSEQLGAGDAASIALEARLTPIWVLHRFGFGVGAGVGAQYWSVGTNEITASLTSYPVRGSVHAMLAIDAIWSVMVKGGLVKGYDVEFSFPGYPVIYLQSGLGGFAEIGGSYALNDHMRTEFGLRYTSLHYEVAGTTVGANSLGAVLSFHLGG
jgi:hypothetical protein